MSHQTFRLKNIITKEKNLSNDDVMNNSLYL
jgi:hypothetical protein